MPVVPLVQMITAGSSAVIPGGICQAVMSPGAMAASSARWSTNAPKRSPGRARPASKMTTAGRHFSTMPAISRGPRRKLTPVTTAPTKAPAVLATAKSIDGSKATATTSPLPTPSSLSLAATPAAASAHWRNVSLCPDATSTKASWSPIWAAAATISSARVANSPSTAVGPAM